MPASSIICESKWSCVVFHHHGSVLLTFLLGGVVEIDYACLAGPLVAADVLGFTFESD